MTWSLLPRRHVKLAAPTAPRELREQLILFLREDPRWYIHSVSAGVPEADIRASFYSGPRGVYAPHLSARIDVAPAGSIVTLSFRPRPMDAALLGALFLAGQVVSLLETGSLSPGLLLLGLCVHALGCWIRFWPEVQMLTGVIQQQLAAEILPGSAR
jgi:hypothetical protein